MFLPLHLNHYSTSIFNRPHAFKYYSTVAFDVLDDPEVVAGRPARAAPEHARAGGCHDLEFRRRQDAAVAQQLPGDLNADRAECCLQSHVGFAIWPHERRGSEGKAIMRVPA